ncbi:MAG TPA: AraC family transcriptional regulator, partial [Rhodothermales bacterium]
MAKAPPSIAATSTLAMICAAAARGVETDDVLARVGLSRSNLEDPDARLPGTTVLTVWSALRERTGDPALQLAAPCALPFGGYRVIDYLVASSATVGDGMTRFMRFFGLIADGVQLEIVHDDGVHALVLEMADGDPVPPVYVDYVYAALVSRTRMHIRRALQVNRVELRQPTPPTAAEHEELFQAPVLFGSAADRLCFTDEEWAAPMETADAVLAQLFEEHARLLAERVPRASSGFDSDVRSAIASLLPEGVSAEVVASALNVSVRTLQRRLVDA